MNKKNRGLKKQSEHKPTKTAKNGMMLMEVSKAKAGKKPAKKKTTY